MELLIDIYKKLPDFSLEISFSTKDNTLGILGASGSGKSMTLRCIAGLEAPDRGRIVLNDRVLFDSAKGINIPSRERKTGLLFQNYALFPHLTVAQNIAFGLKGLAQEEQTQRVQAKLAMLQLEGLENRYPSQLSGGQQQRTALARALAIEPEILLLDEPFSALDNHLRSSMEKELAETLAIYQGVTLFVTHNLDESYRICQDLLILDQGKAIAQSPKSELFQRPPNLVAAQLTGCRNISKAKKISATQVQALDWGCILQIKDSIPQNLSHIGIRAHRLTFSQNPDEANTYPCQIIQTSESPHRMTLYLNLNNQAAQSREHQLQAEVFRDSWDQLKSSSLPWLIKLDPQHLFLMGD